MEVPEKPKPKNITMDQLALIDEMSGLTQFLDAHLMSHDMPETIKDQIRARMVRYSGKVPKEIAKNEIRMAMWGDQR